MKNLSYFCAMKNPFLHQRWQFLIITSILISIIGILNMVLQSQDSFGARYVIAFSAIFVICMIDWFLLFAMTYSKRRKPSNSNLKILLIPTYFIVGVFITFWIIAIGNNIVASLGLELHIQENYVYRRFFAGIMVCLVIFMTNYTFDLFTERQRVLVENEKLLRESIQAQFETLRQQVNPHFLFNSLNTLKTMMRTDVDKAEEYLLRLSEVFRYSLQTTNVEKVTLREEIEILNAYLFMLKGRFGQNLIVDIQIDDKQMGMCVPPFTLQIIVENCVKHNIVSKEMPLSIRIFSCEAAKLTVSNTLQPKFSVESSSQVGLANINKRYQYLSGQYIEVDETSYSFNVTIPLIAIK